MIRSEDGQQGLNGGRTEREEKKSTTSRRSRRKTHHVPELPYTRVLANRDHARRIRNHARRSFGGRIESELLVRVEEDFVEGEDVDDSDLWVLVLSSEGTEVGVERVSEGDGPGGEEGSERRRGGDVGGEDS